MTWDEATERETAYRAMPDYLRVDYGAVTTYGVPVSNDDRLYMEDSGAPVVLQHTAVQVATGKIGAVLVGGDITVSDNDYRVQRVWRVGDGHDTVIEYGSA